MARGLPDYYNPSSLVSQRMVDLAGVMAAITRTSPVDGRGRVAFYETWGEGLFGWRTTRGGNGLDAVVDTLISEIPPASAYLYGGTLAGSGYSMIFKHLFTKVPQKVGVEWGAAFGDADINLDLYINYYLSGVEYIAHLRVNRNTGSIQVDDAGVLTTIDTLGTFTDSYQFMPFKLVCNYQTGLYERLLVGETQYDISSMVLDTEATLLSGPLWVRFFATAQAAGVGTIRIGHVLVTYDEP